MAKYISNSEKQTKQIAGDLAGSSKNRIFALTGELGAGKTAFVQGFAKGLGIKEKIISPTFVLIRQHKIPKTPKTLYHIDLYRLEEVRDIAQLGLKDLWEDNNSIVLIEWAEKLKKLPINTAKISIQKKDHDKRIINISDVMRYTA